jgi:hypothetical protein
MFLVGFLQNGTVRYCAVLCGTVRYCAVSCGIVRFP